MQLKAYSIRDSKAAIFNTPFYSRTHGEAERNFTQLVTDPQTMPGKYPDDYDLYYLGEFDDNTGKGELLDTPQHLMKAVQVKRSHEAATSLKPVP